MKDKKTSRPIDNITQAFVDGIAGTPAENSSPASKAGKILADLNGETGYTAENGEYILNRAKEICESDQDLQPNIREVLHGLIELLQENSFTLLWDQAEDISKSIAENTPDSSEDIVQYLKAERAAMEADPEFKGVSPFALLDAWKDQPTPTDPPWKQAVHRAREEKERASKQKLIQRQYKSLPEYAEFPIDKINNDLFRLFRTDRDKNGQIALAAEKHGSKMPVTLYYSVDLSSLENVNIKNLKRELDGNDRRVMNAVGTLFHNGYKEFTLSTLHKCTGQTTNLNSKQYENLRLSLMKMNQAYITIDNGEEIAAHYNYPHVSVSGRMLEFRTVDVEYGGQKETWVIMLGEPPLFQFARGRNQLTSFPLKLLQSPVSKTEDHMAIEDYLLDRIAHIKAKGQKERIINRTIFEHACLCSKGQTPTAAQKKKMQRAPETIKAYLDHYVKCGHIDHYTQQEDGYTIYP